MSLTNDTIDLEEGSFTAKELWSQVENYANHCIQNNNGKSEPEALAKLPKSIQAIAEEEL